MFESIILGIVQGIAEWLPISSEGVITLIKVNIFKETGIREIIQFALFLHLGTFLAVLIYFKEDVVSLIKSFFRFRSTNIEEKLVIKFLIISTLISGLIGFFLLKLLVDFEPLFKFSSRFITIGIGLLLFITAFLQLKKKREVYKGFRDIKLFDGILLGLVQGFAALPGLSRSGLTISTLLLRKFNDTYALKLSFLMSLPIVLGANILLNLKYITFSFPMLLGFIFSFAVGILTIHFLLSLAKKINFGYFVLIFGILMIISVLF